jgi:hypothetical protein
MSSYLKKSDDPLWIRPEGGWPEVFDCDPKELTQEDIENIEQSLADDSDELDRQLASYYHPITYENMRYILP